MKRIIFCMILVAMISGTISPACAFISGKYGEWIEICSGVEVTKTQNKNQTTPPDVTKQGCDFCFHQTHLHATSIDTYNVTPVIYPRDWFDGFVSEDAYLKAVRAYHTRAPPVFS